MTLPDVTAEDVLAAIEEFDHLGRRKFLTDYGYGEARGYFIHHEGRLYDSKAIAGVAHKVRHGQPLTHKDFTGGDASVAALLRKLGFVVSGPNPAWTTSELVLACNTLRQNNWFSLLSNPLALELWDGHPAVIELSDLLQQLPIHPPETRGPKFRTRNKVAHKLGDIAAQHPKYTGQPRGNKEDREILLKFLNDPDQMAALAADLRSMATSVEHADLPDLDLNEAAADEGRLLQRRHLTHERNPKLRHKKITAVRQANGTIACEVCGFDFEHTYGDRGADFIECHHRTPLHVSGAVSTTLADLALLCSNCHRMIHRGTTWLTVEQLTALVASRRANT